MPDLLGYVSPQLTLAVYYAIGQFSAFSSQACSVSNNHPLNSTVMMQLWPHQCVPLLLEC